MPDYFFLVDVLTEPILLKGLTLFFFELGVWSCVLSKISFFILEIAYFFMGELTLFTLSMENLALLFPSIVLRFDEKLLSSKWDLKVWNSFSWGIFTKAFFLLWKLICWSCKFEITIGRYFFDDDVLSWELDLLKLFASNTKFDFSGVRLNFVAINDLTVCL